MPIPSGQPGNTNDPNARARVGRPIPARALNRTAAAQERLSRANYGGGLSRSELAGVAITRDNAARPFAALLSGSSSPYTATEVYRQADHTWATVTGGRVVEAYEANSISGLDGKVVPRVHLDDEGGYYFCWHRKSASEPPCVCSTASHTAHVTLSDTGQPAQYASATLRLDGNVVQSRIVDASGNATFNVAPRRPCGEWSIKVCLWGFEPVTIDLDGDCPEEGGTTEVSLSPIPAGSITLALTDARGTLTAILSDYSWPSYVDILGNTHAGFTARGWQWCYEAETNGCRVQESPPSPYVDPQPGCTIATDEDGNTVPITAALAYSLYFFPKVDGLYVLGPKFFANNWFSLCFNYFDMFDGYVHFPICTGSNSCFGDASCGDWDPQDRSLHPECQIQRFSTNDEVKFGTARSNVGLDSGNCRPYDLSFAFPRRHIGGTLYDPLDAIGGILGAAPILLSEV